MATREQVAELEAAARWANAIGELYSIAPLGSDDEAQAARLMHVAHARLARARAACIGEQDAGREGGV